VIGRLCFLIAVAAAAGTSVAAAATPVVPVFTQHRIAATVPALAYVPARLAIGWRYERWTHTGALRIFFVNKAGREIVFIASPFSGNCRAGMEKSFQLDGVKVWWAHTSNEQQAWRCVNGRKLIAATSLGPDRFADSGLGRIAASGHRIRY
jgi:DNA-binding LacI/PurR family transcriptional regulator